MKKSFPKVLQVLVSCLLVSYLLSRLEWKNLIEFKEALFSPFFLMCPFLSFAALIFATQRWRILLAKFHFLTTFKKLFRAYTLGAFFNVILPGTIGGDLLRIRSTLKQGLPLGVSSLIVFLERASGLISIFFLGSFFSFFLPRSAKPGLWSQLIYPLHFISLGFFIFLIALAFFSHRPSLLQAITSFFPSFFRSPFSTVKKILPLRLTDLFSPLFLSALFQSAEILSSFLLAKALGVNISPAVFFVIFPVVFVATALPFSLGGLGIREGTMAHLLSLFTVPIEKSILLAFLLHTNRILVALISGGFYFFSKEKKKTTEGKVQVLSP